jgi:hypothetical protein
MLSLVEFFGSRPSQVGFPEAAMAARSRKVKQDADKKASGGHQNIPVIPPDCNVYENMMGTEWGATAPLALAAATARMDQVFDALVVKCPGECPVPRKDKSVGKPTPNKFVIPFCGGIEIQFGFVCDYEIIYGCFRRSDSEPA